MARIVARPEPSRYADPPGVSQTFLSWAHAWPIIEEHWPQIAAQLRAWLGDGWANVDALGRGEPMRVLFMRAYAACADQLMAGPLS